MRTKLFLETERTILRELNGNDAKDFFLLNSDPEVLKYTGDEPFHSIKEAEEFLKSYDQYEKYGVGRLAVISKENNDFLGWCGLKYTPDSQEFDIGFRFFRKFWNQGYATETAQCCLDFGFNDLKIPKIIGRAMEQNTASIKVLEKLGMNIKKDFDFDGNKGKIYEIANNNYPKS